MLGAMALLRLSVVFAILASMGNATTIILTSLDMALGEQNSLWIDENGTAQALGWVGGINATVDGHPRVLWCVQLFVNASLNQTYNATIDFADTPNLQRVGWLIATQLSKVTTPTLGAAFQLAIWDIMEDNGDGFAVGAGKVYQSTNLTHPTDSSVLTAAQAYEAQSFGKTYKWVPVYHNVALNGTDVQDLIGPIVPDGGPFSQAPEPAGVAPMMHSP